MGRTGFIVLAKLPPTNANPFDLIAIELVKPMGGAFPLDVPQSFETTPAVRTMPYSAVSYVLGDAVSLSSYQQFLLASNGSITLTAVGEADDGLTTGTVSAVLYKEVNEMTATYVDTGCTSNLGGLTLTLRQLNMGFTGGERRSRDDVRARLMQQLATQAPSR
jgi:hypothetical protein